MKHRHSGPKVQYRTRKGNIRLRQRPMHIQTLIFPKSKYDKKQALSWAKEHNFKSYTSREEGNSIRVRQFPPEDVKRYGGTFPIGKDVKGVYAEVDKNKFKNKPYSYLKKRFNINPKGDDDRDNVLNYKDCRPWDKKRHAIQSLFHAGNKPPSEVLEEGGTLFGFSNKEHADAWRRKRGYNKIYQFTTSNYDLDPQTYMRKTPEGEYEYSDNEFIANDVISEEEIEE